MARTFLTAHWRNLIMANYLVDPTLLQPYVPPGTELDTWNGRCYASLVGFLFDRTRVLGLPIPFHQRFEEVNLRFYVRYHDAGEWKRGVVFVSEIVPKRAITWVANGLYGERYAAMPMRHLWEEGPEQQRYRYEWRHAGHWNTWKSRRGEHLNLCWKVARSNSLQSITGAMPDGAQRERPNIKSCTLLGNSAW